MLLEIILSPRRDIMAVQSFLEQRRKEQVHGQGQIESTAEPLPVAKPMGHEREIQADHILHGYLAGKGTGHGRGRAKLVGQYGP